MEFQLDMCANYLGLLYQVHLSILRHNKSYINSNI